MNPVDVVVPVEITTVGTVPAGAEYAITATFGAAIDPVAVNVGLIEVIGFAQKYIS